MCAHAGVPSFTHADPALSEFAVLSAKTKRSANRVRQALKLAAMSLSHRSSALGAFYRHLCNRMDKPSANTAAAHKLARMVYFMLSPAATTS